MDVRTFANQTLKPTCRSEGMRVKFNCSILGSSAVERSTVNRLVAGSNPARGAYFQLKEGFYHVLEAFFTCHDEGFYINQAVY